MGLYYSQGSNNTHNAMYQTLAVSSKSPGGLVSKQSCLPCRRKKKKCDGVVPVCGLCQNSYKRDDCIWLDSEKFQLHRRTATTSSNENVIECRQVLLGHELPDELVNALPYLSREEISQAANTFQLKALCNNPSYERSSVLLLALSLAIQHEPLMHAWISCILLATSDDNPQHRQLSVIHYNQAVSGLGSVILEDSPTAEWKRATALLCHAIELLQPVPSSHLARSHLKGAQCMFKWSGPEPDIPESEHGTLLLEAYILRTTLNCLSQQNMYRHLSLDYVSKLLGAHRSAMERLSLDVTPQHCPWLGALGPDLTELIYRVSWMIANRSSSSTNNNHHHHHHQDNSSSSSRILAEAWDRCTQGLLSASASAAAGTNNSHNNDTDHHHRLLPIYTHHARTIHFLACQALLATLIPPGEDDGQCASSSSSSSSSHNTILRQSSHRGLERLEFITRPACNDDTLLWPLVIFGALLRGDDDDDSDEWHRNLCETLMGRYSGIVPASTLMSILSFWKNVRGIGERKERFEDCLLLRQILF